MALFKGRSEEEIMKIIQAQDQNKYLDDPDEGISLIKKMLIRHEKIIVLTILTK